MDALDRDQDADELSTPTKRRRLAVPASAPARRNRPASPSPTLAPGRTLAAPDVIVRCKWKRNWIRTIQAIEMGFWHGASVAALRTCLTRIGRMPTNILSVAVEEQLILMKELGLSPGIGSRIAFRFALPGRSTKLQMNPAHQRSPGQPQPKIPHWSGYNHGQQQT